MLVGVMVAAFDPSVFRNGKWDELMRFLRSDFRVDVDLTCVGAMPRPSYDPKWSLDSNLPLLFAQSPWFGRPANATLVAFNSRQRPRHELSTCARKVRDVKNPWLMSSTDRGRCCDGGQLRDPRLLGLNFLVLSGERRNGPWLFREVGGKHAWRAPKTSDTAPRVRCFDKTTDVCLPPPAFLRGEDREPVPWENRSTLVMHAEGGQGPPEYELRRAVTRAWAPDWWQGAMFETREKIRIKKVMSKEEHEATMRDSRFCLVVEGYSPWTPRLVEAIKHGCVPVLLSPSYRPPFVSVLDWSKFSVIIQPADIPDIPAVLAKRPRTLFDNLLKVRRFFSYCLEDCKGDDALPLVLFEMATRRRPLARHFAVDSCDDRSCVYAVAGKNQWNCTTVNAAACRCSKVHMSSS